jgi:activator of HSP90 ATPase
MDYPSRRGVPIGKTKGESISMKVKITVNIENTDGSAVAEPTTIDVDVPEFEEFTGPEKFGEVFDQYERKVLKARNEAIEAATEKYLSELAQKKPGQSQRREKEK